MILRNTMFDLRFDDLENDSTMFLAMKIKCNCIYSQDIFYRRLRLNPQENMIMIMNIIINRNHI